MIKAVFLDVDGTLVSYKTHGISQTDIAALEQAKANGIKIFVASGRDMDSPREASVIDPVRPLLSGISGSNGQQSFKADGTPIAAHPIDPEDMLRVHQFCETHGYAVLYDLDHTMKVTRFTQHVQDFADLLGLEPPVTEPLPDPIPPLYKVCVYCTAEEALRDIRPLLQHTRMAFSRGNIVDLMPEGIGKETSILDHGAYYGFTSDEVMAIGDGDNDMTILKAAGVAVAMGNAVDEVKAIADYVTTSVDDGGIANALKHYGLI